LAPADPDIVIYATEATHVGDVKYKDWERAAGARADLYQLLVHAAAFDGESSFLVYPHDKFEAVELGDAVTGSTCSLFAVDVRDVPSSVRRCAARLGIPVEEEFEDIAA
jgi:5-methylcytosine-specific restriction endonuclease McrBC regulatory subunit McrC